MRERPGIPPMGKRKGRRSTPRWSTMNNACSHQSGLPARPQAEPQHLVLERAEEMVIVKSSDRSLYSQARTTPLHHAGHPFPLRRFYRAAHIPYYTSALPWAWPAAAGIRKAAWRSSQSTYALRGPRTGCPPTLRQARNRAPSAARTRLLESSFVIELIVWS